MSTRNQRDSQRSKFYNWMNDFTQTHSKRLYDSPRVGTHLRRYTDNHAPYPRPPDFQFWKKSDYHYNHQEVKIYLPQGGVDAAGIAVLTGWYFYANSFSLLNEAWHGPTFCRVWASVYSDITGIPEKDIVNSMRAARLKVLGEKTAPGARIVKKRENLTNLVNELEAAIKRGREEFEQFLQPILSKLKEAKDELREVESNFDFTS